MTDAHAQTYVTRAEAAMLLLNTALTEVPDRQNNGLYPDVVDGQWYVSFIMHAVEAGLIRPHPTTGLVYPHRLVSRAEFLKMMTAAFRLPTNLPFQYTNIPPQAWYRPYIGLAYRHALFTDSQNPLQFDPNAPMFHSEASEAIHTVLRSYPGLRKVRQDTMQQALTKQTEVPVAKPQSSVGKAPAVPKPPSLPEFASEKASFLPSVFKQAMQRLFQRDTLFKAKTEKTVVQAVNNERAKFGLPPLRENELLTKAALNHAKDMHHRGYFSHFTPEGFSYVDRIRRTGYMDSDPSQCTCEPTFTLPPQTVPKTVTNAPNFTQAVVPEECTCIPQFAVGENIAKGQLTVEQVMADWLNSEAHRRNILRSEFEEIGVGIYGNIWAQNFGRLRYE